MPFLGLGNRLPAAVIAAAHAERAMAWAQLSDQYRAYALTLHELALGEVPQGSNDVGPLYVRQALAMQHRRMALV